jgi:hypothetical protein
MARDRKPRPAPSRTSITEVARRYHAAAVALAQTLGLPLAEVLAQHRESVTAIFIECGRCELRLPAGVPLPRLAADAPVASANGQPDISNTGTGNTSAGAPEADVPDFPPPNGEVEKFLANTAENSPNGDTPTPTTIPAGLPCVGQTITQLSPAQLRMLLSKVDQLAAEQGSSWRPLLEALAAERQARLDRGRKKNPPGEGLPHGGLAPEGNGHGA